MNQKIAFSCAAAAGREQLEDANAIASDVSDLHARLMELSRPDHGALEEGLEELRVAVQRLMVLQGGAVGGSER